MLPGSSCPNALPSSAKINAKLARQQYFLLSSPDTILWANFLVHLDWIWTNDNCHCAGGKLQTALDVVRTGRAPITHVKPSPPSVGRGLWIRNFPSAVQMCGAPGLVADACRRKEFLRSRP